MLNGGHIRASIDDISGKRQSKDTRILLTGATGFLGIHLAQLFIKKGYTLFILARPLDDLSAGERVYKLLDWLDPDGNQSRVHIVSGDLNCSDLGLCPADYHLLASSVDEIIHCASDTSFSERKRPQIEKANIENLHHLLDFAANSRCCFFHFISTAYVAGKKRGSCPEALVETQRFFNVYEETKYRAEKTAAKRCSQEGMRLNIYRPSIVYGNSCTGKTLRFNAMYYPVKMLVFLKNLYHKNTEKQTSDGAEKMGISFDSDGTAHMPIRIEADASGGINLIPVDFFTAAFFAIMESAIDGDVFHITNDNITPVSDIIDYTQRYFHITGLQAVRPEDFPSESRNSLEILFSRYTQIYRPYMKDERIFDNSKAAGKNKSTGHARQNRIQWVLSDAEHLGFAENAFNAVIVGYGIRNLENLHHGLQEIYRVLIPGGKLVIMEFSIPQNRWLRILYHWYSFKIMPTFGKMITGEKAPFIYLAESIRCFPPPEKVQALLESAGFIRVTFQRLSNGLVTVYSATKLVSL